MFGAHRSSKSALGYHTKILREHKGRIVSIQNYKPVRESSNSNYAYSIKSQKGLNKTQDMPKDIHRAPNTQHSETRSNNVFNIFNNIRIDSPSR